MSRHVRIRASGIAAAIAVAAIAAVVGMARPLAGPLAESAASAGTSDPVVIVEVLVPPVQTLSLEPVVLDLPVPTSGDLRAGHLDLPEAVTARIRSNEPWSLAVRRADEFCAPVECKQSPGAWQPIDETWTVFAMGAPTEEDVVTLSMRIPLSWQNAVPGTHELRLDYRLSPAGAGDLAEIRARGVR